MLRMQSNLKLVGFLTNVPVNNKVLTGREAHSPTDS